jgi:phosphate transport system permease protein
VTTQSTCVPSLVALALAISETAPMLCTAGWSASLLTGQLTHSPVGYLTYPIWTFYNLPSKTAQDLSYDAAFLLIVFLVLLIILGRLILVRPAAFGIYVTAMRRDLG